MTQDRETTPRGRTCVGCAAHDVREAFVRLVLVPSDETPAEGARASTVVADIAGGAFGRGAHVHPKRDCLEKACRAGLSKAFKTRVIADPNAISDQIKASVERRIGGLLLAAKRTGAVAIGADATCGAADAGAGVVIIAADAGTVVNRSSIERAVADGRAVVWGDKDRLAALLGEATVAVAAVTNRGVADSIVAANALIHSLGFVAPARGRR